jgi:hypothetical protein
MLNSYYYQEKGRTYELMREKLRVIELKEMVDAERLLRKNLNLEARLLKLKILKLSRKSPGLLPRLSQSPVKASKLHHVSFTPHPRKSKFF